MSARLDEVLSQLATPGETTPLDGLEADVWRRISADQRRRDAWRRQAGLQVVVAMVSLGVGLASARLPQLAPSAQFAGHGGLLTSTELGRGQLLEPVE